MLFNNFKIALETILNHNRQKVYFKKLKKLKLKNK